MAELVAREPAEWVKTAGRLSYRFRQHLQAILLAVCLLVTRPVPDPREAWILAGVSALLVALGGAIRSWAMGYHTWRRIHGGRPDRTLVTAGPYAHTRNPLYLGSLLIGAGVAGMSGWVAIFVAFLVVYLASHFCIIRWEEGRLTSEFGEEFARYAASVPRLFPGVRSAATRHGAFSFPAMMRCMEPAKTIGFLVVIALMAYLRLKGWSLTA